MPDHCHLLILPDNEIGNISQILHDWKSYTAQIILRDLRLTGQDALSPRGIKASTLRETQAPCLGSYTAEQGAPLSIDFKTQEPYNIETQAPCLGNDRINILKSAGRLWQERFDSFSIYSDKKLKEKLNYIHNNPIRAGLVKNLDYYPWSSYQNYYLNNNLLIRIDY